ncbi:MAG: single-stranded DNA-binding protein [Brevinemataceae bacterium]
MAWDINRVVLVGRLSNDVELRYTPSGAPVARFGIAVGGRPSKDGQDSVSFFTVVVWNKAAETANQYLSKGKQIAVDGRLEQRAWTAQDGTRRSVVEIVADRLEFLSGNPSQSNNQNNYSQKPQAPAEASSPKREDDYYDNTGFNDTPLDQYDPFDEDVPF